MKKIFSVLTLLAAIFSAFNSTAAVERRSGFIEMQFDLSSHEEAEEASLWIPYPVSDKNQAIEHIKITGNFEESAVYSDRDYSTPMLYARWNKGTKDRKLIFSFFVDRREAVKDGLQSSEAASWNSADYAKWLSPTSLGPINGKVKDLADEITKGKSTLLEKARAIYDWVCDNTYRDPDTRGCGLGDVLGLLEKPGGKCADIHSVFVALARAAGVPSREVFGIRQGKEAETDVTSWQHCWAEFYLPGAGWVPVDPGDVRKMMLKRGLSPKDPVPEDLREAYWGRVDAYRVRFGIGRDLTLNPPQKAGKPVNYLMYPYGEIGGRPLDWLSPEDFKYKITYREKNN